MASGSQAILAFCQNLVEELQSEISNQEDDKQKQFEGLKSSVRVLDYLVGLGEQDASGSGSQRQSSTCESSQSVAPTREQLLDAVLELQQTYSRLENRFDKCFKRQLELIEQLLKAQLPLAESMGEMDVDLKEYRFLAQYRDYIGFFRLTVAKMVREITWESLAYQLDKETELPEAQRARTKAVEQALETMGFSWEEWCELREIADRSVTCMHTGREKGKGAFTAALAKLRVQPMPSKLQHAKETLKKALEYLRDH